MFLLGNPPRYGANDVIHHGSPLWWCYHMLWGQQCNHLHTTPYIITDKTCLTHQILTPGVSPHCMPLWYYSVCHPRKSLASYYALWLMQNALTKIYPEKCSGLVSPVTVLCNLFHICDCSMGQSYFNIKTSLHWKHRRWFVISVTALMTHLSYIKWRKKMYHEVAHC